MSAQIQQVPKTAIIEFDEFAGKLAEFKIRYDGVVYDLTVPEQEKKARSDRFSIGKVISRLDEAHKALKAPLKEKVDLLDGERKRIKDDLLAVQDKIKSQIETHEAKIAAHEEGLQARVDEIRLLAVFQNDLYRVIGHAGEIITSVPFTPDSVEVNRRLSILAKIEVDDTFEHRKADAALAKMETTELLKKALLEAELHEAEQAELTRLRKEKEDRERADREEKIRLDAISAAEAKAKEQAEQAKIAQERAEERIKAAEAQSKAIKEKAEREAVAAQERAKKEQSEAVARAERAERERIAKEQAEKAAREAAEKKAEESRVAKKSHRAKVEREAADSILNQFATDDDDADGGSYTIGTDNVRFIIGCIRDGKIAHVRLEY